MGYRLHVARKFRVEYALGDAFNYKVEEFHDLLSACGAEYTGEIFDADFEVSKEDWTMMIEKLKNLGSSNDAREKAGIQRCISYLESTDDEVIRMLEYYLKNSDPENDDLHLSFF